MKETVEAKAERYLAEGRVKVVIVAPELTEVEVRGAGPKPYLVRFTSLWTCECPAGSHDHRCAHVLAAQKIVSPVVGGSAVLFQKDEDLL